MLYMVAQEALYQDEFVSFDPSIEKTLRHTESNDMRADEQLSSSASHNFRADLLQLPKLRLESHQVQLLVAHRLRQSPQDRDKAAQDCLQAPMSETE